MIVFQRLIDKSNIKKDSFWIISFGTAGFIKAVPSVYNPLNGHYLSIPEFLGIWGNRFQETHGTLNASFIKMKCCL